MWLRLVNLVVLPTQALVSRLERDARPDGGPKKSAHLSYAKRTPLVLPQQLQRALGRIVVVLGDRLEHRLWQLDVAVLVFAIGVSACQESWSAIPARLPCI
jgi:hypothetical protein